MKKIVRCPHCGCELNLSSFDLKPKIPEGWCKVKIYEDENVVYLCDECKKESKEGYIKYNPVNYELSVGYEYLYKQPKAIFICEGCARKHGIDQQYLLERRLVE